MEYGWGARIKNGIFVLIAIILVVGAFIVYRERNKNIVPYNEFPNGTVLVAKNSYVYPYKTITVIYKDGTVKKSKIVDEITDKGEPKEKYKDINDLNREEIAELEKLLRECDEHRVGSYYTSFDGILIKTPSSPVLEPGNNFDEKYVKKIVDFINEASNVQ